MTSDIKQHKIFMAVSQQYEAKLYEFYL